MLEAEIGAKRAHVDGILKSIEMMTNLEKEASNDGARVQGMEG
jgi:cyanate lyase